MHTRKLALVAVLSVALVAAASVGVSADPETTIDTDPDEENVTATHTVTVEVGGEANGSTLSAVEIAFEEPFVENGGSVAQPAGSSSSVTEFGVDNDSDGEVELGAVSSVSTNGGNARLTVTNTSGPSITAGDVVILTYTGAENPANGTYDYNATLNPQSAAERSQGTLQIGETTDGGDGGDGGTQAPLLPGADNRANDPDGDGQYEDVNGDGTLDLFDALSYYNNRNSDAIQTNPAAFDFDSQDEVGTLFDALALWNEINA